MNDEETKNKGKIMENEKEGGKRWRNEKKGDIIEK